MSVPMLATEDATRVNRAITDIEALTEKKECLHASELYQKHI